MDGSGEAVKQGDDWKAMGEDTGGGPWGAETDVVDLPGEKETRGW